MISLTDITLYNFSELDSKLSKKRFSSRNSLFLTDSPTPYPHPLNGQIRAPLVS